jgi:hypothetical protein
MKKIESWRTSLRISVGEENSVSLSVNRTVTNSSRIFPIPNLAIFKDVLLVSALA